MQYMSLISLFCKYDVYVLVTPKAVVKSKVLFNTIVSKVGMFEKSLS